MELSRNYEQDPDLAYDDWRLSCAHGEQCPSCGHIANHDVPISVTMDLLGTVMFRCEMCGHEWPDEFQHAPKVTA